MIRIQQLKMDLNHKEEDIEKKAIKELRIKKDQIKAFKIVKKSIDARKKNDIKIVYTIDIEVDNEKNIAQKLNSNNIMLTSVKNYSFPLIGQERLKQRPIIVGTGPAGLFCALMLAKAGYQPIVLERGKAVEERFQDVQVFWETGKLDPESNVQFGEGGAGTFSDGKLNTMVKDEWGRNLKVLEALVEAGAPSEILYHNKPHIGTDYLRTVVKNIREEIKSYGGEILFNTKLTDLIHEENELKAIEINNQKRIPCNIVVLSIGHSARDTFEMLYNRGLDMTSKSFAIGVRIEHPQSLISKSQFGENYKHDHLPVAEYKLTHKGSNGRGVYSFCMCPGGFVVNASSEEGGVVTNGMSNFKRDEINANSALIVTVTPEDFNSIHPLAGVEFQRKWERQAFQLGGGNYQVPVQLVEDFFKNKVSKAIGDVKPSLNAQAVLANLNETLPPYVVQTLKEGIQAFDQKIKGFGRLDAVLSGVETRTSSPVKIARNEGYESNIKGVYPCGEGAGYAGGITSAAMDGMKVAEAIAKIYRPS